MTELYNHYVVQGTPVDVPINETTEVCLVRQFVANQRPEDRGQPLFISCPCKQCTPHSLG